MVTWFVIEKTRKIFIKLNPSKYQFLGVINTKIYKINLNFGFWVFKRRHLVFMKLTRGASDRGLGTLQTGG